MVVLADLSGFVEQGYDRPTGRWRYGQVIETVQRHGRLGRTVQPVQMRREIMESGGLVRVRL